ncbi:AraC family transcriptional regulator [Amorphus orientalis]|uniref:AraC-like DNA-binding protein n=1 Tax=Amorphus orientalis TaxID=649198 RepID=A0AAE3VMQ2_9HYPH|nr:AraC family transcriptional regulator [Amorphus orientalis]MDQ0314903.1 AraC-like DNA-binding protein [Amorphus orientalis]
MSVPDLIEASEQLGWIPGLHSLDVAQAEQAIGARYRPHRLRMPQGEASLDFRHHAIEWSEASLNLLRYGPEIEIEASVFETFYMLEFPLSGGVDVAYGRDRVSSAPGRGLILSPGPFVRSNWQRDTTQIMLRLDRTLVEKLYQRYTGAPVRRTPVFKPEIALDTPVGRRLERLFGLLVAEQIETGTDTPLSPVPLIGLVIETLFADVPCALVEPTTLAASGPLPRYVHRFRELLDDPASLCLSIAALCERLDVSQRSLTLGMRRFTGLSPYDYLTMRRMEHARELLDSTELPISTIAARVGYAHPGRFAAIFRSHCGSNPSRFASRVIFDRVDAPRR